MEGDGYLVAVGLLAAASCLGLVWTVFEVWLFTSKQYPGHVIDIRRAPNPNGPDLFWSVRVKGWIEGVRFDRRLSLLNRPPDTQPIRVNGRLVLGRPFVRAANFPMVLPIAFLMTMFWLILLVMAMTL